MSARDARYARRTVMALCAVLLAGAACRPERRDVGTTESPLVFMLGPFHGEKLSPPDVDLLSRELSARSGLVVRTEVAPSSYAAIQAFGAGKADAGLASLFSFLLARGEYDVKPFLRLVRMGGQLEYRGELLVRADAPYRTLKDLQGARAGYVQPQSVSGFLLPASMLAELKVQPFFAGSVPRAIQLLNDKQVDVAAVFEGMGARTPGTRVLATTESVPNEPVFARAGLPEATVAALRRAFMEMHTAPGAAPVLARMAEAERFDVVTDDVYAPADELVRRSGRRVEDLVPGGRNVLWSNRSALWGD